ncbi:hybrid sensor histidine kinase/response regulator transcription factor [Mariniphaga anaerophila]|nr:hybrid sensor histidine kinase/response regulator transcription factor [Mariniphaga anaerophila]
MRSFIAAILLSLGFNIAVQAQQTSGNRDILFENISNSQGLSQSTVFSIVQDTLGYMWFATQDGLNRYDGVQFRVFRDDNSDSTTVISHHIRVLFNDDEGNLWIGGNKGISKYNYEYDNFRNYPLFDQRYDRFISDIEQDSKGRIWAGSFSGNMYKYNPDSNDFSEYKISYNGERLYYINDICACGDELLVGTEYGLYSVDVENETVKKIDLFEKDPKVRKMLKCADGRIWVGTEGNGLLLLNRNFDIEENYLHKINNGNSLCNNNVRSLSFDNDSNLWIGTFVGLSILDKNTGSFSNYYQDYTRPYTLSQNSVRSLYKDKEGGMWLGTFYGGINFYHPHNLHFDLINQNGGTFSLNDNVLSCITEDAQGKVWIGTNDGGVNCWNRKDNTVKYFMFDESDPNTISSNNIKSLVFTDDQKLLVGTHKSGLNLFDPETGKNIRFKASEAPGAISDNSVYALLKDRKSQIWVGAWGGLEKFNLKTKTFELISSDSKGQQLTSSQITSLFEDSQNRIWIGTFEGLNIFYPEKRLFESFRTHPGDSTSLSHDFVNCIYEDSKKRIWIGTNGGLNIFNEIERNFKRITTEDGLESNVFFGILEDDQNRMWISTNQGIISLDHQGKSMKNYLVHDGIQNTQFNNFSYAKLNDGYFLFGGIKGLTMFRPDSIKILPFNSKVLLTSLSINSQKINSDDETGILENHINQTNKIILNHDQNTITLDYSAVNYVDNENITYLTKLDNFNKQWWRSDNSVTFSQLPPGEYTFKVKAVRGEIAGAPTSLQIVILKPWYLRNWALVLYIFLLAVAAHFVYKFAMERMRTLHDLRVERLEKEKLSEINQMKLQFFTNISHEFRTPLTLILSPLEKILEKPINDEWLRKQILLINKNASRLLDLIDQLLEFRKSETGKLKLNVSRNELVGFVNDIYLSFASVAAQNKIVYSFNSKEEKLEICFDKNIIERIFFNLLSNAFKFTPNGGKIGINLHKNSKSVVIEVTDSGKGIPKDKLSLIFERYYSVTESNVNMGTGIGLALTKRLVELHYGSIRVESEEGIGSKFVVTLPISESVYSESEISAISVETGRYKKATEVISDENEEEPAEMLVADEKDTILIVEDNADIVAYLKDNFSVNYNICTAPNGEEALKVVEQSNPALIISDVMMPVMDGIKFCKKIKQNIKTSHIPVILLTAKTSVEDQMEGLDSGADDYLPKPFSVRVLEKKVFNLIKSRKRLQDYYSKSIDVNPEEIAFNSLDQEILEKSKEIIEKYLSDPDFSVEIFAREIGMSRSNLHLKLKAITGESATDFIKKIRLGKAVKLLEENKYSISEISYMVGYSSPSYFTTSFKKYFGYLPTGHLDQMRK